jgi:DNA-binding transcriptional MerR regulator
LTSRHLDKPQCPYEDSAVLTPTPPRYSIEELERHSGVPVRTIRSYIARKLLPGPFGRSRAAAYGDEHLENLRFLQAVRGAVPYELPLVLLKRLIDTLPREQIARIARGDEAVHAEFLGDVDATLLRRRKRAEDEHDAPSMRALSLASPRESGPEFASPFAAAPHARAPHEPQRRESLDAPDERGASVWTELEVTPDLRISMRGLPEQTQASLHRLARQMRAWLDSERSG